MIIIIIEGNDSLKLSFNVNGIHLHVDALNLVQFIFLWISYSLVATEGMSRDSDKSFNSNRDMDKL